MIIQMTISNTVFKLAYTRLHMAKYRFGYGHYSTVVTTCALFIDGSFIKSGIVTKDSRDTDDKNFAMRRATAKAISYIGNKNSRTQLWKAISEQIGY